MAGPSGKRANPRAQEHLKEHDQIFCCSPRSPLSPSRRPACQSSLSEYLPSHLPRTKDILDSTDCCCFAGNDCLTTQVVLLSYPFQLARTYFDRVTNLIRSNITPPVKQVSAVCEVSVVNEIESCAQLCRTALAADPLASFGQSPLAPGSPQACFDFVLGIPYDARRMQDARRLKRDASERGHSGAFVFERYLALQAYLVALPRLNQMSAPDSIKRQFCITCRYIATLQEPDERLALESAAFAELAQIVTLRRFHAGQCTFDVKPRMPFAWLLKAHPFHLPGFLKELWFGMRGIGPYVEPHINYWRANQIVLLKREHERSIWRIAQFVEEQPAIRGLMTSSWLYGVATGEESPHLAWLRAFYADDNAQIIDAGPALEDAGFLVGNERRRQLYAEGRFRPRETIVLWSRKDMLGWARRHAELADGAGELIASPAPKGEGRARPPTSPRRWQSGSLTLIDGRRMLYYSPRSYITLTLLLPALLGASIAGAIWSAAAMPLAFVLLIACLWVMQYFFLQ